MIRLGVLVGIVGAIAYLGMYLLAISPVWISAIARLVQ